LYAPLALVTIAVCILSGCGQPQGSWQPPASSEATRPQAIPAADVLTPATPADIAAASASEAESAVSTAVRDYLGPGAPRWRIVASRHLGDYLLLWVAFPDIADGGIDLVYSKSDQRVKWQFRGGERG
jgi:hypothetical protein